MKNILVLTYWSYPEALIQTYTLPYLKIIRDQLPADASIFLVTLEKDKASFMPDRFSKISSQLFSSGIQWRPFAYKTFGFGAALLWLKVLPKLWWLIITKRIDIIHCWCTPAGAVGYVLSVLTRRRLILDSYEPHAESMVENGTWKRNSIAFKLLFWLEQKQTARAVSIIAATAAMKKYAEDRYGVLIKRFFVKPACVDLSLFNDDENIGSLPELTNKLVCVYAGKFGGIYLMDEVFDFIKAAIDYWGNTFCFLILTNHTETEILACCNRAGVDRKYVVVRFVPHNEVPKYMSQASFAITPVKPVPSKRFCTPIKDGEYWALGLPVVIPQNISDDSDIIANHAIGAVLESFTRIEYEKAIAKIDKLLNEPDLKYRIREVARKYRSFSIAEAVYEKVYQK